MISRYGLEFEGFTMTIIRAIQVGDCAAFAQLAAQLGFPCRAADVRRRLEEPDADQDHTVLVAEVDGAVAGWAEVRESHAVFEQSFAELVGLVVDEALRGQGVAAQLVAAAEGWAEEHGYTKMRVRSNIVRTRTHVFYERLGYTRTKSQHVFENGMGTRTPMGPT